MLPAEWSAFMVRLLIWGDIALYREGLAHLLRRVSGLEVIATAATCEEVETIVDERSPEIVLFDMSTAGGLESALALLRRSSPPRIVALAVPDAEDDLLACAEAGISGYVTRKQSVEELVSAIESVARGELLCSPRMAAVLQERVRALTAASHPADVERLTPREREIVGLIDEGLSNKAIARQLRIELSTVKNHVHNILEKLGVHHRREAAARLRPRRAQASPSVAPMTVRD